MLALVDATPRLEVDAAERHGRGDRVEGGLGDSDADHGWLAQQLGAEVQR